MGIFGDLWSGGKKVVKGAVTAPYRAYTEIEDWMEGDQSGDPAEVLKSLTGFNEAQRLAAGFTGSGGGQTGAEKLAAFEEGMQGLGGAGAGGGAAPGAGAEFMSQLQEIISPEAIQGREAALRYDIDTASGDAMRRAATQGAKRGLAGSGAAGAMRGRVEGARIAALAKVPEQIRQDVLAASEAGARLIMADLQKQGLDLQKQEMAASVFMWQIASLGAMGEVHDADAEVLGAMWAVVLDPNSTPEEKAKANQLMWTIVQGD